MTNVLEQIQRWFVAHGLTILAILVLSLVANFLLGAVVRYATHRVSLIDGEAGSALDKRAKTISTVLRSAGSVLIVATAVVMVLQEVGVPVAPLLASVGVVGLAFGLGAQTLVKDTISGLFILIENQYMVEDVIEVNGVVGTIEEMTLRTTMIRDVAGVLYVIPNGEIRIVANRSRGWSRAIVDVSITYEADVDRALSVLQAIGDGLAADAEMALLLRERPQVTGVEGLEDWAVRLRLMVKTAPNQHWAVQRELRRRIRLEFAAQGIDLAFPRHEVALIHPPVDEKAQN
ncbi:MAG: mechanosensitive ion channel family protein [Chloroflexi bacterium]|nr:mechanosensitive ion channel family protein [Chloroflexota bacterium]